MCTYTWPRAARIWRSLFWISSNRTCLPKLVIVQKGDKTPLKLRKLLFLTITWLELTCCITSKKHAAAPPPSFDENSFRSINLHKADYIKMNELLSDVDWDALLDLCSNDPSGNEFVELVQLTVLQVCLLTSPKKCLSSATRVLSRSTLETATPQPYAS